MDKHHPVKLTYKFLVIGPRLARRLPEHTKHTAKKSFLVRIPNHFFKIGVQNLITNLPDARS